MKKIYVIDDDKNIVESISIVLTKEGFQVGCQNNDEDIAKNVLAFEPDLIVLDVMFPENDGAGFEIAREIKNHDKLKNIPIIMLSAINEKGSYAGTFSNRDRDDSFLPVEEFVEKPINPKKFVEKVKFYLESTQNRR